MIAYPDFANCTVLVIGDVMLDRYFWGDVERISPESPVPVVRVNKKTLTLGGAGNVAKNLKGLKCQQRPVANAPPIYVFPAYSE